MTRLRMSRPSWSVPSAASVPSLVRVAGGAKRASSCCSLGSAGAKRPGSSAQSSTPASTIRPKRALGAARNVRVRRWKAHHSGKTHPRVEDHIKEVHGDVEKDQRGGDGEHDGL